MIKDRRFIISGAFSVFFYFALIIIIFIYLDKKNTNIKLQQSISKPKELNSSTFQSLTTPPETIKTIQKIDNSEIREGIYFLGNLDKKQKIDIQKKKKELLKEKAILAKKQRLKKQRLKKRREIKRRKDREAKKRRKKKKELRIKREKEKLKQKKLKEKKALKRKKELEKKKKTTKDLFQNLKTSKPKDNYLKITDGHGSGKNNSNSKGIKNAYISKITDTLTSGFPEQSSFAGEEITIRLIIDPSGDFIFKILKYSKNEEFNESMRRYLEQLKSIGLGKHKNRSAYKFNIIFVAKD